MEPCSFRYESMGTTWRISLWDKMSDTACDNLQQQIVAQSQTFDQTYSRFIRSSLIWSLTKKRGIVEVPPDLVLMLQLYGKLHDLSGGKCNPLVGFALSDLGYDAEYSLKPKEHVRSVPDFSSVLRIIDDTHIELLDSVLIDLGALGKGFFVEKIAAFLQEKGIQRFLVDGSGDMFYRGNGEVIRVGLEHPGDATKAIGVLEMKDGALCGSGSNRRRWGNYHHTIDPFLLTSPEDIVATWVLTDSAAVSDGLATCLFLTEPERYRESFEFEYCILNSEYQVKRSAGFQAELF